MRWLTDQLLNLVDLLGVEAMKACESPLSFIRAITEFLLPKDHHRPHAAVGGYENLYCTLCCTNQTSFNDRSMLRRILGTAGVVKT
jgi:hypothetical protein